MRGGGAWGTWGQSEELSGVCQTDSAALIASAFLVPHGSFALCFPATPRYQPGPDTAEMSNTCIIIITIFSFITHKINGSLQLYSATTTSAG